jgi:hypothetical protein
VALKRATDELVNLCGVGNVRLNDICICTVRTAFGCDSLKI